MTYALYQSRVARRPQPSLLTSVGSLPPFWTAAEYGAALIDYDEQLSDDETDYELFFQSGGSGETALDYVTIESDPLFTRMIQIQHLTSGNTSVSYRSGTFTGVSKLWFRNVFRMSSTWESGISYKFNHGYISNPNNRLRLDIEHGQWAFGFVASALGTWNNTRLCPFDSGNPTKTMAQPSGTTNIDGVNLTSLITASGEAWELVTCIERLSSPAVDGMSRVWVRQYTANSGTVVNPGIYYFNGAYHTGTTTNFPLINDIRLGVNRNEAALNANEWIRRGRFFIWSGTDFLGLDSMRPSGT